ncbi:type II toxin-antitoxin system RelE/ParE family toxin [Parapedobacter soli]|uniref:type II toxin-antitoxin system RelE/ParE family toxin n=1 Tax=Parapedobacter soli TaxID=416955 RepID=UPI0021C8BF0C|nr:type II toxin-antitoxin system RelE/ParE family toxin [Parapedobacter soli]
MSYSVKTIPVFERDFKKLAKKYPSLKSDLAALIQSLKDEPEQGTPLGKACYKIRMAIKSKGKGKSGGSRVITCVRVVKSTVHLLTIYDKSEKEDITDGELNAFLAAID